jgi:hypothetical protein
MVTCVPFNQASTRCAALSFGPSRPPLLSLSHLLTSDVCLSELQGPPLGSCAHRPVRNHEMQRFIHERSCYCTIILYKLPVIPSETQETS